MYIIHHFKTLTDDYRLFVGNLGKEVNDHMLSNPFMQYPSFIKAHVVKNRQTSMTRGCYGFVSFGNSADYLRAIKELNGIIMNKVLYYLLNNYFSDIYKLLLVIINI